MDASRLLRPMVREGHCKGPDAVDGLKPMAQGDCDDFNKKLCGRGPGLGHPRHLKINQHDV